jgi:hypothetical protein
MLLFGHWKKIIPFDRCLEIQDLVVYLPCQTWMLVHAEEHTSRDRSFPQIRGVGSFGADEHGSSTKARIGAGWAGILGIAILPVGGIGSVPSGVVDAPGHGEDVPGVLGDTLVANDAFWNDMLLGPYDRVGLAWEATGEITSEEWEESHKPGDVSMR